MELVKYVQENSYNILIKVTEFCDSIGVDYFLVYGTLLGAKRHRGFIPWDDDIDIAMDLKNYKKFKENIGKLPEKLTPYYEDSVLRIFDESCDKAQMAFGSHRRGVFIDIFPFYKISERKVIIINKYLNIERIWDYRRKVREKNKVLYFLYKVFFTPVRLIDKFCIRPYVVKKWEGWLNEDIGNCITWSLITKSLAVYSLKDIYPLTTMFFVDREFKVPVNTDKVLEITYGKDYMTPVRYKSHFE